MKYRPLLLCLLLLTSLLFACQSPPSRTPAESGSPAVTDTSAVTALHTSSSDRHEYDPNLYVVIRSPEDLMAFNRSVNLDEYSFRGMTVVILNDLDLSDCVWTPLNGKRLPNVTFEGNGHTIRGLRLPDYEYPYDLRPEDIQKGCGFIDVTGADITFRDLTLADTRVNAYDHSVGNFIGSVKGGAARFENCASVSFTAEGWVDWFDRDPTRGGHAVAMRMGGFIGCLENNATADFQNCAVENLTLSGFHTLAGFVGYDETGALTPSAFANCAVKTADLTFSYRLSESYKTEYAKRFVSVFYNAADRQDHTAACIAAGNTYRRVTFYDYADDCAPYTPEQFPPQEKKEDTHDP